MYVANFGFITREIPVGVLTTRDRMMAHDVDVSRSLRAYIQLDTRILDSNHQCRYSHHIWGA